MKEVDIDELAKTLKVEPEIEYIKSPDKRIEGWYVSLDSWLLDRVCKGNLTWTNRGNGPDVITDGVDGPFRNKKEAELWIGNLLSDMLHQK